MHKTVVINAVGLTPSLIGRHTPRLAGFRDSGKLAAVGPVVPAVTTTVQTTYLTGKWPTEHGIVGNGWYFRDEAEVKFWKQSDGLVQRLRLWDNARQRDSAFTCANLFWWYAMYSSADYTVTPRPMYPADGRKLPDVWTHPPDLRHTLQKELGQFPLFHFWGPDTNIEATQWIADAALAVDRQLNPTLSLVYLPHLDYCMQKRGPDADASSKDLAELDGVCGKLIDHFNGCGARIIILSEYGIESASRPVHLNRLLREKGLLAVRDELGRELLDAGASKAFAVADHQIAHIYVKDKSRLAEVKELISSAEGVEIVLDEEGKRAHHLDHPRAGELVAIAKPGAWFTYYYWLDASRAPDFAPTVDIHRKPGYDPAELFMDPAIPALKMRLGWTLAKRKMGFRSLFKMVPTHGELVRGSHGRAPSSPEAGAMLMTDQPRLLGASSLPPTDVHDLILSHVFEST